MTKSDREIMDILEAYDLTKTFWSAAELTGHDPKTVKRYVQARDNGLNPFDRAARPKAVDAFLEKIEEWVDASKAKIRADVVHDRLATMGYRGSPRSTRRAVNAAKTAWRAGKRRTYRPWIPEPGMWLQFDWGEGPTRPHPDPDDRPGTGTGERVDPRHRRPDPRPRLAPAPARPPPKRRPARTRPAPSPVPPR